MRSHGFTRVVENWQGPRTFTVLPLITSQLMWRREHFQRCFASLQAFVASVCWVVAHQERKPQAREWTPTKARRVWEALGTSPVRETDPDQEIVDLYEAVLFQLDGTVPSGRLANPESPRNPYKVLQAWEALERIRRSPGRSSLVLLLMSAADGELPNEDGEDAEAEKACAAELIALLDGEKVGAK